VSAGSQPEAAAPLAACPHQMSRAPLLWSIARPCGVSSGQPPWLCVGLLAQPPAPAPVAALALRGGSAPSLTQYAIGAATPAGRASPTFQLTSPPCWACCAAGPWPTGAPRRPAPALCCHPHGQHSVAFSRSMGRHARGKWGSALLKDSHTSSPAHLPSCCARCRCAACAASCSHLDQGLWPGDVNPPPPPALLHGCSRSLMSHLRSDVDAGGCGGPAGYDAAFRLCAAAWAGVLDSCRCRQPPPTPLIDFLASTHTRPPPQTSPPLSVAPPLAGPELERVLHAAEAEAALAAQHRPNFCLQARRAALLPRWARYACPLPSPAVSLPWSGQGISGFAGIHNQHWRLAPPLRPRPHPNPLHTCTNNTRPTTSQLTPSLTHTPFAHLLLRRCCQKRSRRPATRRLPRAMVRGRRRPPVRAPPCRWTKI
jgi:hypothetical protein